MAAVTAAILAGVTAVGSVASVVSTNKRAKEANEAQQQGLEAAEQFITEAQSQARQDLFKLFPQAQETRRQGTLAGLNVLSQTIPAQVDLFRGGNIAAQNQLIQTLPQFQNAILGRTANTTGGFQPANISPGITGQGIRSSISGLQLPGPPVFR